MPYCQKVSIRVRDSLIMEEISFLLCVVRVPTSSTGAYRMKTEVTVVKCGSTTLGPVRLDQQTGSPCYGTIICTLQLELSSLKHGMCTEHIPTTFNMGCAPSKSRRRLKCLIPRCLPRSRFCECQFSPIHIDATYFSKRKSDVFLLSNFT